MTYLQPREGITGTLRDFDDLLSLDEKALARRAIIRAIVSHLIEATLVGNPAPVVARMSDRMRNPQSGDLVIEQSTAYARNPDQQVMGFGILISHRVEWACTDAEWEEEVAKERDWWKTYGEGELFDIDEINGGRATEHAWYVQYGPNPEDVCRWENCSFIAVPTEEQLFSKPAGSLNNKGGTVFTRDSLLSALSDSGFDLNP